MTSADLTLPLYTACECGGAELRTTPTTDGQETATASHSLVCQVSGGFAEEFPACDVVASIKATRSQISWTLVAMPSVFKNS